jgi:hypothetical protein
MIVRPPIRAIRRAPTSCPYVAPMARSDNWRRQLRHALARPVTPFGPRDPGDAQLVQVDEWRSSAPRAARPMRRRYGLRGALRVIDADLGRSGTTATGRDGFREIVSRVCLGEVGAIFGLEISRLAC